MCFRNADLLIGGLEQYTNIGYGFSPTTIYYRDDITWCLNSPEKFPQWMNFYIILRDSTFPIFTFFSFYITSGLLYALTTTSVKPLNYHQCMLIIFQVMLNMSTNFYPKKSFLRVGYILGVLSCLIITVTVIAYYTMFTIVPLYMKQADTIKQLESFNLCGEPGTFHTLKAGKLVFASVYNQYKLIKKLCLINK